MKKKIVGLLLCVAMVSSILMTCSNNDADKADSNNDTKTEDTKDTDDKVGDDAADTSGGRKFGYTAKDGSNPFFITVENAIKDAVEANGDQLITSDPQDDVALQITQIEDMIAQGIDGMFLNPAEAEGIKPALDQLKAAGIPVINFDAAVADLDLVNSYVGSDNYNAGVVCAEDLIEQIPDGGKIIVLDEPTANSGVARANGFLETIEGKGFEVVATQDGGGNLEKSMGVCEDLLQANTDIVAIFCINDPSALGALAAAKAANMDVLIYGVDGSPDIKASMAEGSLIAGTGAQSPMDIGTKSVEVMYDVLAGKDVDADYPVDTFLINKDNVEEYGTDGWQ